MMLYELFSWIEKDSAPISFINQRVKPCDLVHASLKASQLQREAMAEIYQAKLTPSAIPKLNPALEMASHARFSHLIHFIKDLPQNETALCLYALGISYLLLNNSKPDIPNPNAKIASLFKAWLIAHKTDALAFYHTHIASLSLNKEIESALCRQRIMQDFATLCEVFSAQVNALDIAMLLKPRLENPEHFAAAMLYLCQQQIPIEAILQSGLLQDFSLYNLISLAEANNPISQFYSYLKQFEQTTPLALAAETVRCNARGFKRYALTGRLCEPGLLRKISISPPAIKFSISADNFERLYNYFGQDFLQWALIFQLNAQSDAWGDLLQNKLNPPDMTAKLLTLIKTLAKNQPNTLATLAAQLTSDTIERLLKSGDGAILHLLPYKLYLSSRIGPAEVAHYLLTLGAQNTPVIESIPALIALFKLFRITNKLLALPIYTAILDISLVHTECLLDQELIKILKKFPDKLLVLLNKCEQLEANLKEKILNFTPQLNLEGYQSIEDCWLHTSRQLDLINQIQSLPSRCPNDIYALQCQVASHYLSHHANDFELDKLLDALGVDAAFCPDTINNYERLLIEMLSHIDNKALRAQIITRFSQDPIKAPVWLATHYANNTLWQHALENGNLGLIQWLETQLNPNHKTLSEALMQAANLGQWALVRYFIEKNANLVKPKKRSTLLCLAAHQGAFEGISLICDIYKDQLRHQDIEHALDEAMHYKRIAIIRYLFEHQNYTPCEARIICTLQKAIQIEALDLIAYLAQYSDSQNVLNIIDRAFIKAANDGKIELMAKLYRQDHLAPSPACIEKAFLKASEQGHIDVLERLSQEAISQTTCHHALISTIKHNKPNVARFICTKATLQLNQSNIESTLIQAAKLRRLNIIKILCEQSRQEPRGPSIEQALIVAVKAKGINIVDYLSHLANHTIRPIPLKQALELAIKSKNINMVNTLSQLANPSMLETAFLFAVKKGTLEIVATLVALNPPSPNALYFALRQPACAQNAALKEFLLSLRQLAQEQDNIPNQESNNDNLPINIAQQMAHFGLFSRPEVDEEAIARERQELMLGQTLF